MDRSLVAVAMRQHLESFERDKDAAWMAKSSMKRLLAVWISTNQVELTKSK